MWGCSRGPGFQFLLLSVSNALAIYKISEHLFGGSYIRRGAGCCKSKKIFLDTAWCYKIFISFLWPWTDGCFLQETPEFFCHGHILASNHYLSSPLRSFTLPSLMCCSEIHGKPTGGSVKPAKWEGVPKGRGEVAFLDVPREGCVLILACSPSCVPTSAAILTVDIFLQLVVCWLPDALPGERAALYSLVPIRQSTSIRAMNCGCEMLQTYRIRGLL